MKHNIENPEVLKKMRDNLLDTVFGLKGISNLGKLILCRLILVGGISEEQNSFWAKLFGKSPDRISKTLGQLVEEGYVHPFNHTSNRMLAVIDSDVTGLYNYNYFISSYNNNIINYNNNTGSFSIRTSQIWGITLAMQYEHYVFTPDSICRELDKVSTKDWVRLIKMQSFGSFVLRIARLSANAGTLELDDQPDLSYFKQDFYKLLQKLLHQKGINVIQNTPEDVAEPGPTEEELAREENERKLSQYITRARKERMIEVRSHTHLQKLGIGDLVIIKGEVKRYYEGGRPVMCNYILILSNGDEVHALITNEHYKQRGEELKSYVGEFISFEGKVINNPFLKKKSIKSEPLYFPVSKIDPPDDLNTKLDFQYDE